MSHKLLLKKYLNHPMHKGLNLNVTMSQGVATVEMTVSPEICNLVGILHGNYYFKIMDDACFFAALSLNKHEFVATANFNIHYFSPASKGQLIASAQVVHARGTKYVCECTIVDKEQKKYGCGSGLFIAPHKQYKYNYGEITKETRYE